MNKRTVLITMLIVCTVFSISAVVEGLSLFTPEKGRSYKIVYGGRALHASYRHSTNTVIFSFQSIQNVEEQKWLFPETDGHFNFIRPGVAREMQGNTVMYSHYKKALAVSPHGPIPWDIMDSDEFKWRIENAGSGKVYFFNRKTGTYLNASGTGLVMGAKKDTAKFQLVPQ